MSQARTIIIRDEGESWTVTRMYGAYQINADGNIRAVDGVDGSLYDKIHFEYLDDLSEHVEGITDGWLQEDGK